MDKSIQGSGPVHWLGADRSNRPRLKDITSKVNNHFPASPRKFKRRNVLNEHNGHQESLQPASGRQRNAPRDALQSPAIENKRLSAVVESQRTSKRCSQSSASTNASTEFSGRKRKSRVGPWLLGSTLGQGATCRVRKAKHTATGLPAAVKIVSRNVAKEQRSESVVVMDDKIAAHSRWQVERRIPFNIEREVLIMKLIQHPHVMRLYDVWENRGEIYLVLEYVENGELFGHIMEHGHLSEQEAVRIFRQIIAGLEHCHFYNLCHRDLKPENILLDSQNNVKIADFGMASVRHSRWLRTSCGSPHYAAPEVVSGLKYEGQKADIWSAGVVLYVMLCGRQPFGSECEMGDPRTRDAQLKEILRQVVNAEVILPAWISDEAEDLVMRILDPNPASRITISAIWEHPLLRKYEWLAERENWLGDPQLDLTGKECGGPIPFSQLDMDVVTSLCMLWHTTSEELIIRKLISHEPNHERLLYHRLLESRQEQEENFQGAGVEISSSDYHHVGKRRQLQRSGTRLSVQGGSARRARSQYSIAETSKRHDSSRTARTASDPDTDRSYDPFRSSRTPMVGHVGEGTKVILLRGSSARSTGSTIVRSKLKLEHPALSRVRDDALSQQSSISVHSSPRDAAGNPRTLRRTDHHRHSGTRSSLCSSAGSTKTSTFARNSFSYKRGVSFAHIGRRSGSSCPPIRPAGPSPSEMTRNYKDAEANDRSSHTSISSFVPQKSSSLLNGKCGAARLSVYMKEEARQVSLELERFCERAFHESMHDFSSGAGNLKPHGPENPRNRPVPPPRKSSINQSGRQSIPQYGEIYRNRPLPELPEEPTLNARRLQKYHDIRNTIIQTAEDLPPGSLSAAMRTMEDLIRKTETEVQEEQGMRISSAPTPRTDSVLGGSRDARTYATRHVSEPLSKAPELSLRTNEHRTMNRPTIRVVNDASLQCLGEEAHTRSTQSSVCKQASYDNRQWEGEQRIGTGLRHMNTDLCTIQEDDKEERPGFSYARNVKDGKFRNWFRRSNSSGRSNDSDKGPTPPTKDCSPHSPHFFEPYSNRYDSFGYRGIDEDIEPTGPPTTAVRKNRGLLNFLTKRDRKSDPMFVLDSDGEDSFDQSTTDSYGIFGLNGNTNASTSSVQHRHQHHHKTSPQLDRPSAPQAQNWFARLLRVKPAQHVVALHSSKNAALKEVRGILRDWKRHGMRDIVSDRIAGKIWARVDVDNALGIKPVTLRVEFFTILLYGRKQNLSLARFTQDMGAKSSFDKVTKTMEGVLRGRGVLVTNRQKVQRMRKCLKEWEQQQV